MSIIIHFLVIIFAVSLDGFTVGFTYGLRKILITPYTIVIIMFCSGVVIFLSMSVGAYLRQFLTPTFASYIGGCIFICLGMFLLVSMLRAHFKKVNNGKQQQKKHSYATVMNDPTVVDADQSGTISTGEAFVLGFALSLDAFGAGFAAAILGYSPIITACFIALASGVFLSSGIKLGHLLIKNKWIAKLTCFPPILLIFIGIFSFI